MNPSRIASICSLIVLIGSASALADDSAPAADGGKAPAVHKTYDIRALLISIANVNDAPDLSRIGDEIRPGAGHGLFNDPPNPPAKGEPTRQQRVEQLISWIRAALTPGVRKSGVMIREENGILIVDATAKSQEELAALLADLDRGRSVEISVESHVISLNSRELDQLDAALARKLRIAMCPIDTHIATTLSDAELDQMTKAAIDTPPTGSVRRPPRVTLFNRQRAYVLVTTQQPFVADYVAKKDGAGVSPQIKVVEEGVVLDIEAASSQDHRQVSLKTHLQLSELKGFAKKPFAAAPADKKLMVDVPILDVRDLQATNVIPSDTIVLLGYAQPLPMRPEKADLPAAVNPPHVGEHVFLVVKARVFEEK